MSKLFRFRGVFTGGVEAQNELMIPYLAGDPGAPANGSLWVNSVDGVLRIRVDGATVDLGVAGTAPDSVLFDGEAPAFYLNRANHTGTQLAATISNFAAAVAAQVIDAATLQGSNLAQVIAAAIAGVVDTAPGTLDTLNELAAALGDDPNFAATITALIATKARTFEFTTVGGALTENVDHNLNTFDVQVQVFVNSGTRETEEFITQRPTVNRVTIVSEGGNIPAGRRVVVVAKGA